MGKKNAKNKLPEILLARPFGQSPAWEGLIANYAQLPLMHFGMGSDAINWTITKANKEKDNFIQSQF